MEDAHAMHDNGSVADALEIRRVPLAEIHLDPANARTHNDRNIHVIRASLQEFGQVEPLVVQKGTGKVIGGNGRLEAMRQLGWSECDIVEIDADRLKATALGIVLNRSAELAEWDQDALAGTLRALQAEDFDLESVGFTDAEVDSLYDDLSSDGEGDGSDPIPDGANVDAPRIFDDEAIVESAFAWFRENGFPYRSLPIYVCMKEINKLAATDPEKLPRTVVAYQVADTYHRHRFHAAAEGMCSPHDSFCDDASLRKAIRLSLEHHKDVETVLWIVNGTQACANFRPGFACKLYRDYCKPGDTVLDASTGYGGRLVGFMASGIAGRYIGIDPNVPTHEANRRMAADLGFADRVELLNLPAEDVSHGAVAGRCDFAFTSPPYFCKEHYGDDATQSWVRYRTAEAWRDGSLAPMLRLQFAALKPGKFAIVNIADVTIRDRSYPLVRWAVAAGIAAGFVHVRTDQFALQRRFGADDDDEVPFEPVVVFRKPDQTSNGSSTVLPP